MNELTPIPFAALGGQLVRELEQTQAAYDLPVARFFPRADHDVSCRVHGHRASMPFDLVAGPHAQFAQNIVLLWLAGDRVIELKTVQIEDELAVPCPNIHMQTTGFNVELVAGAESRASLRNTSGQSVSRVLMPDNQTAEQTLRIICWGVRLRSDSQTDRKAYCTVGQCVSASGESRR